MKHRYIGHWLTIAGFSIAMLLIGFGASAQAQDEFAVALFEDVVYPDTLTIFVGDTIVWINIDTAVHAVDSGTPQNPTDLFHSGDIPPRGATFSYTFTSGGTYPYYSHIHPELTGVIIVETEVITPVTESEPAAIPVVLYQNVPNPFNSETMLSFDLNRPGDVTLSIYTVTGQKVWEQVLQSLSPGHHSVKWNASDASGLTLSGGIYLYTLKYEGTMAVRRMLYMK
jgi:plastocyanin